MGEYRRTYQQKFMQVRKNKENKKLAQDFENWKKQAKKNQQYEKRQTYWKWSLWVDYN